MRVGQNRKRDANEADIVAALRRVGARVWRLSGAGVPDLLISHKGRWHVLEIKKPRQGKLTDAQCNTRALAWFPVATTVDEALRAIGCLKGAC